MKEEQLIDAIGKLDAEMFDEIVKIKTENETDKAKIVPIRTKRRSVRRWLVPVAACLALMVGGLAAYASGALDGLIHLGTDEDGDKVIEFIVPENNFIPVSELTGEVRNTTAQMKDRLQYYLADEPLPNDGMIGMFAEKPVPYDGDYKNPPKPENVQFIGFEEGENPLLPYSFNVGIPGRIYKPCDSIAEGEAYIGYEPLHLPALDETPLQIGVLVEGINEGGLINATPDSEFEIQTIGLYAGYWLNGKFATVTSACIDTVDNPGPRTTVLVNSQNSVISSETRTVGGREFTILTYQPDPGLNGFQKCVYHIENRVVYSLEFTGYEEAPAEYVEQVLMSWMNSFSEN